MHQFLPYYYSIKGYCKDGFTYVLYINGGHPPWTLIGMLMINDIIQSNPVKFRLDTDKSNRTFYKLITNYITLHCIAFICGCGCSQFICFCLRMIQNVAIAINNKININCRVPFGYQCVAMIIIFIVRNLMRKRDRDREKEREKQNENDSYTFFVYFF